LKRAAHNLSSPWVFLRAAAKQARHIASHKAMLFRSHGNNRLPIPVYFTTSPHPYSVCYQILHRLGVRFRVGLPVSSDPALVFLWCDATFCKGLSAGLESTEWRVVNHGCLDISKNHVDLVHQKVFQYSLQVDPTVFMGKMVEKSNLNGSHDGREVDGPLPVPRHNSVYQRIVNNIPPNEVLETQKSDIVCDLRIPVFDDDIPFVYMKLRPRMSRFSNKNTSVQIAQVRAMFDSSEIERIRQFSRRFGLDYGEIDVVRDAADDRIYILDVNKTPLGPPNGLAPQERKQAFSLYEAAFTQWFEQLVLGPTP
jgi:hypothetical protein